MIQKEVKYRGRIRDKFIFEGVGKDYQLEAREVVLYGKMGELFQWLEQNRSKEFILLEYYHEGSPILKKAEKGYEIIAGTGGAVLGYSDHFIDKYDGQILQLRPRYRILEVK